MAVRPRQIALAVALAGSMLTACSTPPPVTLTTQDVVYLNDLRQGMEFTDDSLAMNSGRRTCDTLDSGTSLPEAVTATADELNLLLSDASLIAVAAITNYCPRHSGLLTIG